MGLRFPKPCSKFRLWAITHTTQLTYLISHNSTHTTWQAQHLVLWSCFLQHFDSLGRVGAGLVAAGLRLLASFAWQAQHLVLLTLISRGSRTLCCCWSCFCVAGATLWLFVRSVGIRLVAAGLRLLSRGMRSINRVHFFDISTSKIRPNLLCFVHFDLETCFTPQRRATFRLSSSHLAPEPPL